MRQACLTHPLSPTVLTGKRGQIFATVRGQGWLSRIVHLIVIHHHLRPGGVRRVIELGVPHLLRAAGSGAHRLTVAAGEAPEEGWMEDLRASIEPADLRVFIEPAFRYLSEQRQSVPRIRRRLSAALATLLTLGSTETVIWAHNLGLGRNPLLTAALVSASSEHHVPLVEHHHDWWFDNRWKRWMEFKRSGIRTLSAAADLMFPGVAEVRHAAINRADAGILARHLPSRSEWMPNLMEKWPVPSRTEIKSARRWLEETLRSSDPVWLLPCRLLRRKNVAEALLLTRWLRPEAWMVTTGGASSADEQPYRQRLQRAADGEGWRLRLGVLAQGRPNPPTVPQLIAASEAVVLTSVQEGFGLTYLEAAAAGKPLLSRSLPNVAPDLRSLGLRFPQEYRELHVAADLFDGPAERRRQMELWREWKAALPSACRRWAETPVFLDRDEDSRWVSFSRLTLTAQLEVLQRPPEESFRRCVERNPFLQEWRHRASRGLLEATAWTPRVQARLSGAAYARRFRHLLRNRRVERDAPGAGRLIQEEFMKARVARENLYPLLWSTKV